jgi:histidinol-phosphate aminotransferase
MRPLVTPGIESLSPYEAGKPLEELERELGIRDAIKLASNENPLGPSPLALEAARRALLSANRYPDASAHRLRARLAAVHGVSMPEIIHGNGSNELIELLIRTFTTPAQHIVFAEPAFVMYRLAALAHGVRFSAVPLRDLTHDLEAMAEAVEPETRLLFIANPNNPTGTHVTRSALERLLTRVREDVIVVMDEAYFEYADAADYPDSLKLRGVRERLVVLRTFSKIYGLAALRVGYGIGPVQLLDYMNRVRAPFNVGTPGQEAALAALDDHEHVERCRRLNSEERARLSTALARLGFKPAPSQANFVYVDCGRPAHEIYDRLLRKGVIVRPFGGLPSALRITVGTAAENDRLLAALGEVLK